MNYITGSLILHEVTKDDLTEVARTWPSDHRPISEEEAKGVIAYVRWNAEINIKGCIYHLCSAVCRSDDPRTIIGWCGLDGRCSHTEPEIFILLDDEYRNSVCSITSRRAVIGRSGCDQPLEAAANQRFAAHCLINVCLLLTSPKTLRSKSQKHS